MIDEREKQLAEFCLETALKLGAQAARITLDKSDENVVSTLNGEVDSMTRCSDRSVSVALYVDGRYGVFSTNKLDEESLKDFIAHDIATVRMLAPDPCRALPEPSRLCSTAVSGDEMGILDPDLGSITPAQRREAALGASVFGRGGILSEEGEYSDTGYDTYLIDSQGARCLHSETFHDYGVELTLNEDRSGRKNSAYWWTSAPFARDFDASGCGAKALELALAREDSAPCRSGRYNMVVDSEVASKFVSPIIKALNGYKLQQEDSFLAGSLGRKLFPEGLTLLDRPHIKGQTGSKLFDSEGVATAECPVIEAGVVQRYFINTYMSRKMGIPATSEDCFRAFVPGWPHPGLDAASIMEMCGDGILVTGFNGGNNNSTTGDFSYGIEGFLFKGGKIVRPVSEMVVTGNFLSLWGGFIAAGEDSRQCKSKLIPTLAFANVDFSGE